MLSAAVIGCGHGGMLSLEGLRNSAVYETIAAADLSSSARQAVADRFPAVKVFADFKQMLLECGVDVLCIATPAPSHVPLARAALERDLRGLLLEKPLGCDVASAEGVFQAIQKAGLPLVVPHGMLLLPAPQEVKTRILSGDIGRLESVEVQNAVDLLNAGIHWLVYLLDVFDTDRPETVSAEFDVSGHIVNDGVQVETRGATRIRFESGLRVDLHSGKKTEPTSDVLTSEERRGALFRVIGSAGVIEFSAWAGSYWIRRGKSAGELIKRPLVDNLSYHQLFLEQLAQHIAAGKPDYRSARLSLAALRLIESAYRQSGDSDWALGKPSRQQD